MRHPFIGLVAEVTPVSRMTCRQLGSLLVIGENGRAPRPTEVGELLHIEPAAVTRAVDALETRLLVRRQPVGRDVLLSLTKEGALLYAEVVLRLRGGT